MDSLNQWLDCLNAFERFESQLGEKIRLEIHGRIFAKIVP